MQTPPPQTRARRSSYGAGRRSKAPFVALSLLLVGLILAGAAGYRLYGFLHSVANLGNPFQALQQQVEPPVGSIAWKLKHGQRVNVLALGYGGAENDAPWLTDTLMVVSIDPANKRILETSVPRDLYVRIDAWQDGRTYSEKINAAFEVPNEPKLFGPGALRPAYQGKDGAGHLAEDTVGGVTGIKFDGYMAVDFKAFRDVVDALGGIQVHMDTPLDDCHYPDYHNGYMNHGVPLGYRCPPGAGIHFAAGDYQVNGEQALELARSRDANQPEQANDFGRAKRQQMIVAAIKKKATSISALAKAPQLMDALQANFRTDLSLTDITALYNFAAKLPDTAIEHFAVTDQNLLDGYGPYTSGSCGPRSVYVLCPEDRTYHMWQAVSARSLVAPPTLAEQAGVQVVNASRSSTDLQGRLTDVLRQMGFQVSDGARHTYLARSVIYDYSGGKYPQTAAWLQDFFGAQVEPPPAGLVPAPGQRTDGLVVVAGSDFASRWYGLS
jgi:anionic cell wall polymer biosynthesis LytR-Cps2A-Psr (LCP) family protein